MITKTISFFNSKGGVGKSVLTNTCANEIKFQYAKNKTPCEIIVFDCDPQQTISKKREEDLLFLQMAADQLEELPQGDKELIRQTRKRYVYYANKYAFTSYDICAIDTSNPQEIEYVKNLINENKYNFVFFDLPGTLEQDGTAEIFSLIEHLFIPLTSTDSDIKGTIKFLSFLEKLADLNRINHLENVRLVLNQTDIIKAKKYKKMIQEFENEYGLKFLESWINRTEKFDTNTIFPISTVVNLNTQEESNNNLTKSITNLTTEIIINYLQK